MSDAEAKPAERRRISPLVLLGGILIAGFAARTYADFAVGQRMYYGWRPLDDWTLRVPFYVFVVIPAALGFAYLGRKFLNPTSACLLGMVGGGMAAAFDELMLGMLLGGVVGATVAWPFFATLGRLGLRIAIACMIGAAAAYAAARMIHEWSPSAIWFVIPLVVVAVMLQLLVMWRTLKKPPREERLTTKRTVGLVAWWVVIVLVVPLGLWIGVLWDNAVRFNTIVHTSYTQGSPAPLGPDWIWPGPLQINSIQLYDVEAALRFTTAKIDALRGLRYNLVQVVARDAKVDGDELLEGLRGAENLTDVLIDRSNVSDASLAHLAQSPTLMSLQLSHSQVRGPGLAHLSALKSLAVLDLHGSPVDDEALPYVAELRGLTKLNLNDTHVSRSNFDLLLKLKNLKELRINTAALTAADLAKLDQLPLLQILHIDGSNLDEPALAQLSALPGLTELHITGGAFSEARLAQIATMNNVRALTLEDCQISDDGLQQIGSMTNLLSLNLNRTDVSDTGLAHLAGLTNLNHLNLADTNVTPHGLQATLQMKFLTDLYLQGAKITDDNVKRLQVLAKLPNLKRIHLQGADFSAERAAAAQEAVPNAYIFMDE